MSSPATAADVAALPPGTLVSLKFGRDNKLGIVLASWRPTGRQVLHLVFWQDGRLALSNFGLISLASGRGWTCSLSVIQVGCAV